MELYNSSKYMKYLIHLFHDDPLEGPLLIDFEPGDYQQFIVDVKDLAAMIRGKRLGYEGTAEIRGFFETFDGVQYRSGPVTLDLQSLRLHLE